MTTDYLIDVYDGNRWLALALLLAIQFSLLTVCGLLAIRCFCKNDSMWSYRIWCTVTVLSLLVLPTQAIGFSWKFRIQRSEIAVSIIPSDIVATRDDSVPMDTALTNLAGPPLVGPSHTTSLIAPEFLEAVDRNELATITEAQVRTYPNSSMGVQVASLCCYAGGLVFFVARYLFGLLSLVSAAKSGHPLSDGSMDVFRVSAKKLRLRRLPLICKSRTIPGPLVFGFWKHCILVPMDFDEWAFGEKETVAMHELSHVVRGDCLLEHFVHAMQAVYWIHPLSHFLAQQTRITREVATDRHVLGSGGLRPNLYAANLLSVVERIHAPFHATGMCFARPFVTMSAGADIKKRLVSILSQEVIPMSKIRSSLVIGALVLVGVASMMQIEFVDAIEQQSDQPQLNAPVKSVEGPVSPFSQTKSTNSITPHEQAAATPRQSSTTVKQSLAGTTARPAKTSAVLPNGSEAMEESLFNDLMKRVSECEVNVPKPNVKPLCISGTVNSQPGDPVANAIVVVRQLKQAAFQRFVIESSSGILASEKLLDVIARGRSDSEGKYSIIAPIEVHPGSSEVVHVFAADPKFGIAISALPHSRLQTIEKNLLLAKTSTMSGTYVTPTGTPIPGTMIELRGIQNPEESPSSGMFLSGSQLELFTRTDANGRFHFRNIPEGYYAGIMAPETEEWHRSNSYCVVSASPSKTTDGRPLPISLFGTQLVESPLTLIAQRRIPVKVRVTDENDSPIEGATVTLTMASQRKTNEQGIAILSTSAAALDAFSKKQKLSGQKDDSLQCRCVFPIEHTYLAISEKISIESIRNQEIVKLKAKVGIRVTGSIQTEDGKPVPKVYIRATRVDTSESIIDRPASGRTSDDGKYNLTLPRGNYRINAFKNEPGLMLPTEREDRADHQTQSLWPNVCIDVRDGASKPVSAIVVRESTPQEYLVLLSNGQPARDAIVTAMDIQILKNDSGGVNLHKKVISSVATTDENGKVRVQPSGIPTNLASIEVQLTHDAKPYYGSISLNRVPSGVIPLTLGSGQFLRGRVLLNDQPVPGAQVYIRDYHYHNEVLSHNSLHVFSAETNRNGEYEVVVAPNRNYNVSAQMPNESSATVDLKPVRAANGFLQVEPIRFIQATESIAGTVVNANGDPIAGAYVSVRHSEKYAWIGHERESESRTDEYGKFSLRKMPAGKYRIIAGLPKEDRTLSNQSETEVETGEMESKLVLKK